jgi:hypothetical protein
VDLGEAGPDPPPDEGDSAIQRGSVSDSSLDDLALRLDDLLKEVRRQGRAAIAAQAAAESCLEAIRAQAGEAESGDEGEGGDERVGPAAEDGVRWLRALIPVADALERVTREATVLYVSRPPVKGRLLGRLFRATEPRDARTHTALSEGLRVLRAQLEGALRDLGVSVDRRKGGPVDVERQRVVEVRAAGPGERETVVEVVRPGYALGEKILREAEVVVANGDLAGGTAGRA